MKKINLILPIYIMFIFCLFFFNYFILKTNYPPSDDIAQHIYFARLFQSGVYSQTTWYPFGYPIILALLNSITGISYIPLTLIISYVIFILLLLFIVLLFRKNFKKDFKIIIFFIPLVLIYSQRYNIWGGHHPYFFSILILFIGLTFIEYQFLPFLIIGLSGIFNIYGMVVGYLILVIYNIIVYKTIKLYNIITIIFFSFLFYKNIIIEILMFILGIPTGKVSSLGGFNYIIPYIDLIPYWGYFVFIGLLGILLISKKEYKNLIIISIIWLIYDFIFSRMNVIDSTRVAREFVFPSSIISGIFMIHISKRMNKKIILIFFTLLIILSTIIIFNYANWALTPFLNKNDYRTMEEASTIIKPNSNILVDRFGRWFIVFNNNSKLIILNKNLQYLLNEPEKNISFFKEDIDYIFLSSKQKDWNPPGYYFVNRTPFDENKLFKKILSKNGIDIYQVER